MGDSPELIERFKYVADQLCYELHRQSSRLRELELENARLLGFPDQGFVNPGVDFSTGSQGLPSDRRLHSKGAAGKTWEPPEEIEAGHLSDKGLSERAIVERRPSRDRRPSGSYRSWSQVFSSQGFESEANVSMVEPQAPNLSELRQLTRTLTRHSLESEVKKSRSNRSGKSARFASTEQERLQFMIMRAEKTRKMEKRHRSFVINPDTSYQIAWQLLTSTCMAFVAIVTPIQVGLLELRFDFLQIISWCVDMVFAIDMVLQFFTMYAKTTPRGIEWETDLKKICRHYLLTWFPLDFVTIIPFDVLSLTWNADNLKELKIVKIIRAVRLLKLMRILKSSRWLHKLEIALSIPYQHIALVRFLFGLVLVCHWLSCFWAMCLHLVDDEATLAGGVVREVPKWIDEIQAADREFGIETRDSPFRVYIASFYFCSYTMTSVGYGDLGPKNILERIVCTVIVLVAGLCWAQILGEVCAISSDMNAENQAFRKKMNSLNRMMQEQGLPHDLRRRLRSFFLQNRYQSQYVVRQKLLTNMSPQLQSEVCTEMNLPWIQKVSFFAKFISHMEMLDSKGFDTESFRACIADTSRQLICGAFAQRESFGNVQILYILSKGLVILNSRLGSNGTVWGEDFVLSDTSLIKPVSGFAISYIEVLALTREAFMAVIERRRFTCPMLGQIVRQYCVRIAVRRGIIAYARSLAREKIEAERVAEREAERRARTLLPHNATERMVAPPSIDELGVFSVSQVPGVMWTEEEDAGQ
eukprot:s2535_g9.t1